MARAVESISHELRADDGAEYDRVIEIDLSTLEPQINGPFTLYRPRYSAVQVPSSVKEKEWPKLTARLIGSCTNSSFEDMTRAASIAQQVLDAGIKSKVP
ncbi:Aconitate hydratase mitochondrial [Aspergillus hancockii]|nr:Aconitate hydratase mitochondrial [Aspergillus hancockii]